MRDLKVRAAWVHFPVQITFWNLLFLCDSVESTESIEFKANYGKNSNYYSRNYPSPKLKLNMKFKDLLFNMCWWQNGIGICCLILRWLVLYDSQWRQLYFLLILKLFCSGGSRISHTEGTNPQDGGTSLLFCQLFPENCMKMKEI